MVHGATENWDVVVIGAGAAGLLAAAASASRGRRTLVLEKNTKLGVKILMSGGTRCNITHDTNEPGIAAGFTTDQGKFLRSALAKFPPHRILDLLQSEGVESKVEEGGKVFPVSNRAIDVRDALVSYARKQGAVFHPGTSVSMLDSVDGRFQIDAQDSAAIAARSRGKAGHQLSATDTIGRQFGSDKLIVACGGKSYPGCGTTGDGYAWARSFGHSIVQPVPALTPLNLRDEWTKEHAGVTLPNVVLTVARRPLTESGLFPKSAIVGRRTGALLLTHFGLSGPSALDTSRLFTTDEQRDQLVLFGDLLPNMSAEELANLWNELASSHGKRSVGNVVQEYLPKRLVNSLLHRGNIPVDRRMAELSKSDRAQLTRQLKRTQWDVSGTLGFDKAEVTAGGVSLEEVRSTTMESRIVPGLHFVGEVLDLDGRIGGYNFQAAFSTGWLAGISV